MSANESETETKAEAPEFERLLRKVFCGDEEAAEEFLRMAGSFLAVTHSLAVEACLS